MPVANEKLAAALESLNKVQEGGRVAIRSKYLTRLTRELLLKHGFLQPVIKGWYVPAMPSGGPGETTAWYTAFWQFCRDYLAERFGANWTLTPEQSLILHAGNFTVPRQLLVRAPAANNQPTQLIHGTSIFETALALPPPDERTEASGLRLYSPEAALVAATAGFFETHPTEARTVLAIQRDASAVLALLLRGGHSVVAGRLAGAFRNIGRDREADAILTAMKAADHTVRETDPFIDGRPRVPYRRDPSPYVQRLRLLWERMRDDVAGRLPPERVLPNDVDVYLREVDALYVTDAYHSLSIEGYRVSPELIERVRSGQWNPQAHVQDRDFENGLAARGYWLAFQAVRQSLTDVLAGQSPGDVADRDHPVWYREMFAPKVAAGLLKPENLAGYRNGPVYLRGSRHVPLNADAVRDAMPAFFDLLRDEPDPAVRVVLGHFIYVFIHPYFDGNGRTGRFLMNVMTAAAGYPWTVIPVEERERYMAALEAASVDQDIRPFADFIGECIRRAKEIRAPA
ncbi:Fic family protein [Brevundimonas viscosa]|uniref:Fic/DOC family protein n=1 Tax=Brevundimonas viscosa TaxID=871741 RepID=A0A1I6SNC5_9CAUL|nr:Fic family protein [Brevundimonas viscosa]SFS78455.1 Fic/DOC family protein [Brevundimonas viscosa]